MALSLPGPWRGLKDTRPVRRTPGRSPRTGLPVTPQVASWASGEQSSLVGAGLRDPRGRNEIKSKVRPFLCRAVGPVTVTQHSPVFLARHQGTSGLVGKELGRLRQGVGDVRSPTRAEGFAFDHLTATAARQSSVVRDSAEGVVAWMSARRSAWSVAWLSVQRVRRRRRSPRGGSPVT